MATGYDGSTFVAELNRLANSGTYPARTAFKEAQAAANVWAGTDNKSLIAALNYKASSTLLTPQYKGLNAVCYEIAGTTNKSATSALRSIDL
jgi:hypothetical protein